MEKELKEVAESTENEARSTITEGAAVNSALDIELAAAMVTEAVQGLEKDVAENAANAAKGDNENCASDNADVDSVAEKENIKDAAEASAAAEACAAAEASAAAEACGAAEQPNDDAEIPESLKKASKLSQHFYKQIRSLFKANNEKPLPFYKLIIHPNNFGATIQNAYQVSILVNHNVINIGPGPDNHAHIWLLNKEEFGDPDDSGKKYMALCRLNFNTCSRYKALYNITEPMLKGSY